MNAIHQVTAEFKRTENAAEEDLRRSPQWKSEEGLRVVLFDLDGTLIDSERARNDRWGESLKKLERVTDCNLDTLLAAYRAIYRLHADITSRVGQRGHVFEDIRQEWNTRISYALLLAWCEQRRSFPKENTEEEATHRTALGHLKQDGQWQSFLDRAEEISDPWSIEFAALIDQARHTFWQGDWSTYVYPGVTDGLDNLKRRNIKYCIATEGHLPTQWRKICAVGLDRWFQPDQLLATSQAARPLHEMRALNDMIAWYRGRADANREAAELLPSESLSGTEKRVGAKAAELRLDAAAADLSAAGLARIAKLFERMATKLYELKIGEKPQTQPEFYVRVLYAINQDPEHPRDRLMQWDLSWEEQRPIRLTMLGDNLHNDVKPVLLLSRKLDKKLMSIWIRQGSHGKEKTDAPESAGVCNTIHEAFLNYLLNDDEWRKRTDVLSRPPAVFGSAILPSEADNTLELQRNIIELLAGVAGTRSVVRHSRKNTPDPLVIKAAKNFVEKVFEIILLDIRDSQTRDLVIDRALVICSKMRNYPLFLKIPGLPQTVVEFVLFLVESNKDDTRKVTECLLELAELLHLDCGEWASAMIRMLQSRKSIIQQIKGIDGFNLADKYIAKLETIIKSTEFPEGFPIVEAGYLYGDLAGWRSASSPQTVVSGE